MISVFLFSVSIIFVAILVIGFKQRSYDDRLVHGNMVPMFFMIAALGCIVFGIGLMFVLPYDWATTQTSWEENEVTQIVSIEDDIEINGIARCSVAVVSENVYNYYAIVEFNGGQGFERKTLSSKNCTIVEGDFSSPKLVKYQRTKNNPLFFSTCTEERYVFYVPEGTVDRELSLDSQN
jgi:hypothetical protein